MSTTYATAKTKRDIALDESGIGHDFGERFNKATDAIAKFCADLQARANRQALYDLTTNVPCGVLSVGEATAEHAIETAIVGACGALVQWDINRALVLAGAILQDVNAHPEAKMLFDLANKEAA